MNNFNEFTFIYKDAMNNWCEAKNPVFIASHTRCRAIKTKEILAKFNSIQQLINGLNDYFVDEKAHVFMLDTILYEII